MLSSNFRGVCNKNLLDECKTDAIRRACFVEFPFVHMRMNTLLNGTSGKEWMKWEED